MVTPGEISGFDGLPAFATAAAAINPVREKWMAEKAKLDAAREKAEAAAAIPLKMVEDVALVGPIDKIKDELVQWKETCITTFLLSGPAQMLEFYADLING